MFSMKTLIASEDRRAGSTMAIPDASVGPTSDVSPGLWAIVPVKPFDGAKARLAAVLSASGRRRLAKAMLQDVLDALVATTELAGILVVTHDEAAARLAQNLGAEVIDDVSGCGTNAAVAQGLQFLDSRGRRGALVVPGDVPLMTTDDLREILAYARACPVVLVPAMRDGGTNLLLTQPPGLLPPCFGRDSFARHVAAARALGIEPCILHPEGIGLDIDNPDDVAALIAHPSSTRTHDVLRQLRIDASAVHGRGEGPSAIAGAGV